jgi:enterobactin synthetase component F
MHRDPQALQRFFAHFGVTTTHFVPSMLAAFVTSLTPETAQESCRTLNKVFCSGEALPAALCREWEQLTAVPLHNLYGPTEAAVDVSWYPAFGEELAAVKGNSVPIGYPVWNTGLRILDGMMQPVPPGWRGSVSDRYSTGARLSGTAGSDRQPLYCRPVCARRTDVPHWRCGAVAGERRGGISGRSDDQLKIRGQRIELGEIDKALQTLTDVAQGVAHACVLNQAAGNGDARQLVGYVVSESGLPLDLTALREQLSMQLPPHMVPVVLLQLSELPLSANGKLDRKALPLPEPARKQAGRALNPGAETQIAQAFSALLGCEIQHAQADFFALGGHSLLAMRLAAQLSQTFERPVTPGQVMVASTVEKLARC